MKHATAAGLLRRLGALALAAATFWGVGVTAGCASASSAAQALYAASPLGALRWELGDLWVHDSLSPAAALTLGESPLLLSARPAVQALQTRQKRPPAAPAKHLPRPDAAPDNGIPARTLAPKSPSGYTVCGSAYISSSRKDALSVPELQELFDAELTGESPQMLILHTHGSEGYTPAAGTEVRWTGDHRTTDTRYSVVSVGDAMAEVFQAAGISVLHDRTLYDYPQYNGSYDRSLSAVESYLAQYPSIRFILDIHRDAIVDQSGQHYKVVSPIEGRGTASQVTLGVGSDGSGLPHPRWKENLKLAVALQQCSGSPC